MAVALEKKYFTLNFTYYVSNIISIGFTVKETLTKIGITSVETGKNGFT